MKHLVLTLPLLISLNAFAVDPKVDLKEFNFSYQAPTGHGTASSFSHNQALNDHSVTVEVSKIDEAFAVAVRGSETHDLTVKDAPAFVKDAQTMEIENLNLSYEDSLSLSLVRGEFVSTDDELSLVNLSLDCYKDLEQADAMDQLLSGCTKNMRLKSAKFSSSSHEKNLLHALSDSVMKAAGSHSRGDLKINNVDLKTVAGKFDLSADVRAQVSGKVKSRGDVSYNAQNKMLTVRISEVKFGILSITGQVFSELKKQQSAKLQVKEPFVYLTVK